MPDSNRETAGGSQAVATVRSPLLMNYYQGVQAGQLPGSFELPGSCSALDELNRLEMHLIRRVH
jgi:hypothetical protein